MGKCLFTKRIYGNKMYVILSLSIRRQLICARYQSEIQIDLIAGKSSCFNERPFIYTVLCVNHNHKINY